MKKIWLVRHGQSQAQNGETDDTLNPYLVLGRKLGNYMIFNGIHLFSRNEDFGETHQKSHFLLILAI